MQRAQGETPELVPQLQFRQQQETAAQEREIQTQAAQEDIQTRSAIQVLQLKAERKPIESERAAIKGRYAAALANPNLNAQQRQNLVDQEGQELKTLDITTQYERGVTTEYTKQMTQAIEYAVNRDPRSAQIETLHAERDRALANIPADDPEQRKATQAYYDAKEQEVRKDQRDLRTDETRTLEVQQKVTGILATAYGPGALEKRREAQIAGVVGQTENEAQRILRRDVTDIANADRVRSIGINQLQAERASYLENMTAQEGSLNRTALSAPQNADIGSTLKSIDKGIQDLKDKIGTLVASD
jgi:hypothetical protein